MLSNDNAADALHTALPLFQYGTLLLLRTVFKHTSDHRTTVFMDGHGESPYPAFRTHSVFVPVVPARADAWHEPTQEYDLLIINYFPIGDEQLRDSVATILNDLTNFMDVQYPADVNAQNPR
uniref:Uncharacterized protein n=1 Tax=Globodera rostochiensis TaxID=31243 RepID=A0A914HW38_GLORO